MPYGSNPNKPVTTHPPNIPNSQATNHVKPYNPNQYLNSSHNSTNAYDIYTEYDPAYQQKPATTQAQAIANNNAWATNVTGKGGIYVDNMPGPDNFRIHYGTGPENEVERALVKAKDYFDETGLSHLDAYTLMMFTGQLPGIGPVPVMATFTPEGKDSASSVSVPLDMPGGLIGSGLLSQASLNGGDPGSGLLATSGLYDNAYPEIAGVLGDINAGVYGEEFAKGTPGNPNLQFYESNSGYPLGDFGTYSSPGGYTASSLGAMGGLSGGGGAAGGMNPMSMLGGMGSGGGGMNPMSMLGGLGGLGGGGMGGMDPMSMLGGLGGLAGGGGGLGGLMGGLGSFGGLGGGGSMAGLGGPYGGLNQQTQQYGAAREPLEAMMMALMGQQYQAVQDEDFRNLEEMLFQTQLEGVRQQVPDSGSYYFYGY